MSTISISPEADAYLAALREELADLDGDERDELLADVEVSLVEAATEETPEQRFGPPGRFAAELRAAAGLAPAAQRTTQASFSERFRLLLADERAQRFVARMRPLAPLWWIGRAYVVAVVLVDLVGFGRFSTTHPEIPVFGSTFATLIVLGALVAASCALGTRKPSQWRRAVVVANIIAVVLALPVIAHVSDALSSSPSSIEVITVEPTQGLARDGVPIRNIYAFDRNGKPLRDVLLYDQDGRALSIGRQADSDPNRRVVRTARGTELFNAFPIRYYEPGTHHVAHPDAGPKKSAPRVATAPLKP